jgi:outer membrane protein TolC
MRPPRIILHLVLLQLLLLSLPFQASAQGPDTVAASPTVTFEEAVRIALSNGRDVHLAAQDVRITAEGRNVASARWLPRLDASGDYTALSEPPSTIIQGTPIQTADKNIWRGRLTAEQTIYDFGRTRSRVDQAGARTDVAERLEGVTRERQALDVISAFLDAKRADALRKVAEESLATAVDHRRLARDQFDVGTVARNDVLAADVVVANAEATLITAEVRVEISRSRLALRMGYPGDRSVTPAPGPYPVPTGGVPPLSESLRAAFGKRDELRAQGASIREGEAAADTARSEFAPTFFGQGGYSYEANDLNPHKGVFSILLGGKVNLFSGFADEASLRQARLAVDRRKETLGKLRDEIALEVKSGHLSVTEADNRKAVAEVAVVNAEENLRIQEERYQEGMAISTEVLDAQTLLTRAKTDRQNAIYDLAEAQYRLLAARGELLDFLVPRITAGR